MASTVSGAATVPSNARRSVLKPLILRARSWLCVARLPRTASRRQGGVNDGNFRAAQSAPCEYLVRRAAPQTGHVGVRYQSHRLYWAGSVPVCAHGRFEHVVSRTSRVGCLHFVGAPALLSGT